VADRAVVTRLGWCWLFLVALVGCPTQGPEPQPSGPPVGPSDGTWVAPKPPPPQFPPPVRRSGATKAGWVESPVEPGRHDPFGAPEVVTTGALAVVVRTAVGHFALHRDRGVVARLRLPLGWFWLGLDGADALYVATADGALYRSDDAMAVTNPAFTPVALVEGAVTWDAAGRHLVAARGAEVLVSLNRGSTYHRATVTPGLTVRRVRVRTDGVIAAWGHDRGAAVTYLSADAGRTWKASRFLPHHIDRRGAVIDNGGRGCPASLAQDGQRWLRGRPDSSQMERWWTDQLRFTEVPATSLGPVPVSDATPVALATGEPISGPEPTCPGVSAGPASSTATPPAAGATKRSCRGVNCLRGSGGRAVSTATQVGLLADAACQPANRDAGDACDASQPLRRAPTLVAVDGHAGAVTLAAAPDGCTPRRLVSIRGAGLLICEQGADQISLYTVSRAGTTYREATFGWPARSVGTITSGDDGTTVVTCDRLPCAGQALVRSPHPLGDQKAWRKIAVAQAVTYRPLLLGAALAITSPATAKMGRESAFGSFKTSDLLGGDDPGSEATGPVSERLAQERALLQRMSFVIARADGTTRPLAQDLQSQGDVVALEVVDGTVYLAIEAWADEAEGAPAPPTYHRLAGGKLVAMPRPPDVLRREPKGRAVTTVRGTGNACGVAVDQGRVYWTDFDRSRVLSVAKTGGKVATLASQQPGAFAIAVDDSHVYFTLRGSGYLADGSVRRVPKQGGTVEQIAVDQLRPEAIVTSADAVYWTARGYPGALDGAVLRASKLQAAIQPLAVGLAEPVGIAVGHGHVWFTTALGGTISRLPRGGGEPQRFAGDQLTPHALTVGGGRATWINLASGTVAAAPVNRPSVPTVLVRGLAGLVGLAVCGDSTYVTTDRGELWVLEETAPRRLAEQLVGAGSVACDDRHAFVSVHEGRRLVAIPATGGKPRTLGGVTVEGKTFRSKSKRPKLKRR